MKRAIAAEVESLLVARCLLLGVQRAAWSVQDNTKVLNFESLVLS